MPDLNNGLQTGRAFGHAALLQYFQRFLKDWGVVSLGCVIATMAVVYAWFALNLWTVEDRIPGNRARVPLVGALIATVFTVAGLADHLRKGPKGFRF